MKKKIFYLLYRMSTYAFYSFALQMALGTLLLATDISHGQNRIENTSIREVKVTIDADDIPLIEAFDRLEAATGFTFAYSASQLPLHKRISLREGESLEAVLRSISLDTRLRFTRVNDRILVSKVAQKVAPVREAINIIEKTIEGTITDAESGEPVIGATVIVKGTTLGTITDINGEYTLRVPEDAEIITVSFVGYQSKEIIIGNQSVINVVLAVDAELLSEVVVIGYGSQSRARVNGAIASTKSQELQQYAAPNVDQQLAGRLAGVQINETGGQPGYDAQVIIRGTGTLTAGRNPLIVVDGVPLSENSSISAINPKDIEKIDVLKDAASAAIYGSRASNGVLLITTKRGTSKRPRIDIDAYTGLQMRADEVVYAGAYDAAQFFTEARDWGYVSKDPEQRSNSDTREERIANGASRRQLRLNYLEPYLAGTPGLTDTDWLDKIFSPAPMSSVTMSVSGASDKTNYYVSGGYFNQDGIAIGTGFERYNANIKINTALSDYLDFAINLNPSYSKQRDTDSGNWRADPVATSYTSYPFFAPYAPDGTLNISEQIRANTPEDGALQENAVAYATLLKDQKNRFRTFGSTHLLVKPLNGLEIKFLLGGDYRNAFFDYYDPSFLGQYRRQAPDQAFARETNQRITNILSENTVTYFKALGNHEFELLGGYSFQKEQYNRSQVSGTDIPDDNITNVAGASSFSVDTDRYTWTLVSYFGRAQYFYKQRYQLSLALRQDGSSRFGDDTKWGLFPSISAGWIVSDEPFVPESGALSYAKLRGSWGRTGNNQIANYGSKALVTGSDYLFGGSLAPGFAATTSPNSELSWETNTSFNIGADLGFFNRYTLSVNYYNTHTDGLLLEVPVPEQSGYSESLQNIGEIQNSGIELELGVSDIALGPVQWSASANLTSNRNKVLALAPGQEEIRRSRNGSTWLTRVGGPIAEIFAYDVTGVYKTQDEINNSTHLEGTLPGDYIVRDVDGNGVIDADDQVSQGTYAPDFFYGFTSNFRYGQFDLSFALAGVSGRTVYNYDQGIITEVGEGFGVPTQYYFDNRYHPENNPDGFFARPNMGNFSSARRNTRGADIYMQDASYLRLRSLQLGYNFVPETISRLGLENLRVYVSGNNVFTITDESYRGFNPDASSSNVLDSGYARDNFPIARTFLVGVNITLK